jgi:hypothetical protein
VLRFSEKGGKSREIPVRHDLEGHIRVYLDAAGIGRKIGSAAVRLDGGQDEAADRQAAEDEGNPNVRYEVEPAGFLLWGNAAQRTVD